jgi:hypothetical protein
MMIVCPVCGAQMALAGDEDTAASEIVMRRREGEVVARIWFTAGPFTDELLHTCDPSEYWCGVIP